MNTIYDNTFVIGDTSATTFQAGPGITVTEPTAGTIRIGTDETVLWSGSLGTQGATAQLSMPQSAFNKIAFYCTPVYGYGEGSREFVFNVSTNYTNYKFASNSMDAANFLDVYFNVSGTVSSVGINRVTRKNTSFNGAITTAANTTAGDYACYINKIVGIGRVSGGN